MMPNEKIHLHIKGLLEKFGYGESDVAVSYDEKTNTYWFSITSPHTRLLFNRDAEALQALNHIATKIIEQMFREEKERPRVIVDANGHEKKKIDSLRTTAHMMAERARYFKSSVEVDPMPPHERRIVHEFLAGMSDLVTESKGEGKDRHIVIKYIGGI
jgi:spoIIIJ-associated protein